MRCGYEGSTCARAAANVFRCCIVLVYITTAAAAVNKKYTSSDRVPASTETRDAKWSESTPNANRQSQAVPRAPDPRAAVTRLIENEQARTSHESARRVQAVAHRSLGILRECTKLQRRASSAAVRYRLLRRGRAVFPIGAPEIGRLQRQRSIARQVRVAEDVRRAVWASHRRDGSMHWHAYGSDRVQAVGCP